MLWSFKALSFFNFLRISNDKRHGGILPPSLMKEELPRPQSDTATGLQAKDISLYCFGRESQISMTPQEARGHHHQPYTRKKTSFLI